MIAQTAISSKVESMKRLITALSMLVSMVLPVQAQELNLYAQRKPQLALFNADYHTALKMRGYDAPPPVLNSIYINAAISDCTILSLGKSIGDLLPEGKSSDYYKAALVISAVNDICPELKPPNWEQYTTDMGYPSQQSLNAFQKQALEGIHGQ